MPLFLFESELVTKELYKTYFMHSYFLYMLPTQSFVVYTRCNLPAYIYFAPREHAFVPPQYRSSLKSHQNLYISSVCAINLYDIL